ncbi:hypothetical protein SDC9_84456 [bioreactor metagenome]|uniref:N-acetyltransferase domain-containing protein n=1 Tax=bioreactor metagenome TaxID=1076179 RepID=A0A644ZAY1_9ZZZZ|nr:GNAT family N-acetyltransferase [Christensenella sp.]
MKKAASIFLRSEITKQDVLRMSGWMKNPDVTRFLNEHAAISGALCTLAETTPEPILAMRLNANGRFFIVSLHSGEPIGYVSLRPAREEGTREIVVVIGEESLWGHGCGARAIRLALGECFLRRDARINRVVATIHREHTRSIRLFTHAGFSRAEGVGECLRFVLSREAFLSRGQSAQPTRQALCEAGR